MVNGDVQLNPANNNKTAPDPCSCRAAPCCGVDGSSEVGILSFDVSTKLEHKKQQRQARRSRARRRQNADKLAQVAGQNSSAAQSAPAGEGQCLGQPLAQTLKGGVKQKNKQRRRRKRGGRRRRLHFKQDIAVLNLKRRLRSKPFNAVHGTCFKHQGAPVCYFLKNFFTKQEAQLLTRWVKDLLRLGVELVKEKRRHDGLKLNLGICGSYRKFLYILKSTYHSSAQRFIVEGQQLFAKISQAYCSTFGVDSVAVKKLQEFQLSSPVKMFGLFPTAHINVNASTTSHKDSCDEDGVFAVVMYAGDFSGGHFCLTDYNVDIAVQPRDVLFVNARDYEHSAASFVGTRHSVVLFMNHNLYIKYQKNEYVECVVGDGIDKQLKK